MWLVDGMKLYKYSLLNPEYEKYELVLHQFTICCKQDGGVAVGVTVGVEVFVIVGVGVIDEVGVGLTKQGFEVNVGVWVGVGVLVCVGVTVFVGVTVGVGLTTFNKLGQSVPTTKIV